MQIMMKFMMNVDMKFIMIYYIFFNNPIRCTVMATIRKVSPFKLDDEGFIYGFLSVNETVEQLTIKGDKDKDSFMFDDDKKKNVDVIIFTFKGITTNGDYRDILSKVYNLTLNGDITGQARIGKRMVNKYNKFVMTLLALKLITENELKEYREGKIDIDTNTILSELLAINNLPVKFKTAKGKKGFDEINWFFVEITGDMPSNDEPIEETN